MRGAVGDPNFTVDSQVQTNYMKRKVTLTIGNSTVSLVGDWPVIEEIRRTTIAGGRERITIEVDEWQERNPY